jgi:hypothetical protein
VAQHGFREPSIGIYKDKVRSSGGVATCIAYGGNLPLFYPHNASSSLCCYLSSSITAGIIHD